MDVCVTDCLESGESRDVSGSLQFVLRKKQLVKCNHEIYTISLREASLKLEFHIQNYSHGYIG